MRRNLLVAAAAMTALIASAVAPATADSTVRASAGSDAAVTSVSCASAGNCAAGGSYSTTEPLIGPAFVVDEKNGTWGQAQTVRF